MKMRRDAKFSADGRYRYSLTREWDDGPRVCFLMLNPSQANAKRDDHTCRCCIRYAQDWGYASLEIVNLFAYVATNPAELLLVSDPIGRDNDDHIWRAYWRSVETVAAWGWSPAIGTRDREVIRLLDHDLSILKLTTTGVPRHPSRLSTSLVPQPWMM
jgi:hypothetical protein